MNKIQLPASFTDLTIDQWQKWHAGMNEVEAVQLFWDGDISSVSLKALKSAYAHLEKLFSEEDARFFKVIEHGDKMYGIINEWGKLTTGEWVDLETYITQGESTAHKVMSILYRPIVRESATSYEIEKYKGAHEMFKDLPICYYLGALVFFCERKNRLLKTSQASLMEVVKQMLSRKGGVGMTLPTTWVVDY